MSRLFERRSVVPGRALAFVQTRAQTRAVARGSLRWKTSECVKATSALLLLCLIGAVSWGLIKHGSTFTLSMESRKHSTPLVLCRWTIGWTYMANDVSDHDRWSRLRSRSKVTTTSVYYRRLLQGS